MKAARILILLLPMVLLSLSACTQKSGKRTLKLSHGLDTQHPVHLAMVRCGELLQSYSDNTLSLEIYPG